MSGTTPSTLPLVLVTNDDGIRSPFLAALVRALSGSFEVAVAAPAEEQSWIGRAVSRRKAVDVRRDDRFPGDSWSVAGTPTDCVQIALGHLMKTRRPVAVVSGINVGYNTTLPLVYSSGTVAAALEGAFWGLPAIAVSQALDINQFKDAHRHPERLSAELEATLNHSARHTCDFLVRMLREQSDHSMNGKLEVHNLNFPFPCNEETHWVRTRPALMHPDPGGFFEPQDGSTERYQFAYRPGKACGNSKEMDREVVDSGRISWSVLNFSGIATSH